jgi:hypothetical protein
MENQINQLSLNEFKWVSKEEIHLATKRWTSELNFIQDEQLFLENLLRKINAKEERPNKHFKIKCLKKELQELKSELTNLCCIVKYHNQKLNIFINGIYQLLEEEIYKETHRELARFLNQFKIKHSEVKKDVFRIAIRLLKNRKEKMNLKVNSKALVHTY